jgi:ATP-binding cassette subfamily B protein
MVLAGLHFAHPLLLGRVVDVLSRPDTGWSELSRLLLLWGAIGLMGIVAGAFVALQADRLAHRRRLAMMGRYFEHVLALPVSYHGDVHSGRVLKTMLAGSDALFGLWLNFFRSHFETFVSVGVLLPLTLFINWRLALVLIVLVAVFTTVTLFVVGRTRTSQKQVERHHGQLAAAASDALANVMVVQSFVRLSAEAGRFSEISRRLLEAQFPVLTWWAVVTVLTRSSATLAVIAMFVVGAVLNRSGEASVGQIVGFTTLAMLLIGRLEQALGFVMGLFFQRPVLEEFFDVLGTDAAVRDKPGALAFGRVRGEVAFEGVSFAYRDGRPAVNEADFAVPAGARVALVGHTGAGKSTAMNLLSRLWDPERGTIRIDGVDIKDVRLASLRANIGVVFQDALLFNRSIADNLRVGRPGASDAELEAVARRAEAHAFITAKPDGYTTLIGERGVGLSGGERQRIAIARALLKDPPILILDEATSALDAATEAKVQMALAALMRGRTTFVIAHRLSTVRDCDLILVFDHGRIVERGRFGELLGRDGTFAELVRTQLGPADATRPAA